MSYGREIMKNKKIKKSINKVAYEQRKAIDLLDNCKIHNI